MSLRLLQLKGSSLSETLQQKKKDGTCKLWMSIFTFFFFFTFGGGCVWEGGVEVGVMVGMGHTKY